MTTRPDGTLTGGGIAPPAPNVLDTPLISVLRNGARARCPLPDVIALLLCGDEVGALPEVPAEHRAAVWRLLVRCATKALSELRESVGAVEHGSPDDLARRIGAVLGGLTAGRDAWALHHDDATRPGFLQVPAAHADATASGYKRLGMGRLTTVPGSKNHERKVGPAIAFDAEGLLYALVEYQFGSVYTKRNYETQLTGSRMGKGSGAPFMGVRLATIGATFRHDVATALAGREAVARDKGLSGTAWALWKDPWPDKVSLPASALDPAFVPLARLVRVGGADADGRYRTLWFRPTESPRVTDHTMGGDLGDPFVARVPNPKAPGQWKIRGVMDPGFGYREVVRLLFGGTGADAATPSETVRALCAARPPEGARVVFEGTAYDQGKSLGFHRRECLLPPRCVDDVLEPSAAQALHAEMLGHTKTAAAALASAVRVLLHGTPRLRKGDQPVVSRFLGDFHYRVDAAYCDHLFGAVVRDRDGDPDAAAPYRDALLRIGREAYAGVVAQVSVPTTQRLRRLVESRSALERGLAALRDADPQPAAADAAALTPGGLDD